MEFSTREVHTVSKVEILGPDGQVETLERTTIHPIWSEDRQDWIPLGELLPGEQLRSLQPLPFELQTSTVLSVLILNQPTAVYNIEVHGEHVYQVGEVGVVVHNVDPVDCLKALDPEQLAKLATEQIKSIKSLQKQLAKHIKKLDEFRANPDAFDNLGYLKNAPTAEIRERIINGRLRHLEKEITEFAKQIESILEGI